MSSGLAGRGLTLAPDTVKNRPAKSTFSVVSSRRSSSSDSSKTAARWPSGTGNKARSASWAGLSPNTGSTRRGASPASDASCLATSTGCRPGSTEIPLPQRTTACGGTVVIMPKFDPEQALRLIDRHRVTTTFMAPTLLQRIMDLPDEVRARHDVSSMRGLILGAAPCPFSLKERAVRYFGECLFEFYGATETGVNLILRPEEQLAKPGSAGRIAPGQEVQLLDDYGNPVADGQPGEVWVRSDWLASYFGRPEATERSMRDGYFSVGDVAYRDADGYYYICDRKVDMVISGGTNIYPAEVEACLHAHPVVQDVAVIGVPDDHWGESVKAIVVVQPGAAASEQELIDWSRGRIADYKRPRSVDFTDELPRDLAGKLLKRLIREPYWRNAGRRI